MRQPNPVRPRNHYGAPEDITTDHGWVHSNIQVYGAKVPEVSMAFQTDDPFRALGFTEDSVTTSIAKWHARPCQVDDSYLISWESYQHPPYKFCDYLGNGMNLNVMCEYTDPVKPKMHKYYVNWHKPIINYSTL